jgi:hypothetical protein
MAKREVVQEPKVKKGKVKAPKLRKTRAEKDHSKRGRGPVETALLRAKVELFPAEMYPNAAKKPKKAQAQLQGKKGEIVNVLYENGRFFYTVLVEGKLRDVFAGDFKVVSLG